jgi:hypothetical protein
VLHFVLHLPTFQLSAFLFVNGKYSFNTHIILNYYENYFTKLVKSSLSKIILLHFHVTIHVFSPSSLHFSFFSLLYLSN